MSDFAVRASRSVFPGRIARVRVDEVAMPGGGWAEREVVDHDRAVAVVALDSDRRVTLIEQYRHPLGRRLWELPAGLMDAVGESPLQAATRELAEEVGVRAAQWDVLVDVAVSPGFTTESVRVFLARELTDIGRQGEIAHEEADLVTARVPLAEAVAGVFDGRVVNASTVAGLLAADAALRDGRALRPAADDWSSGPALVADPRPDLTRDERW